MINERYFIHQKLGEGRSAVFLCTDQEFPGEKPAMKILPYDVDEEEKKYFISEYFTLKKLNHPNIITTNDLGSVVKNTTDINDISLGSKFFTLEYFDGKPLLAYDNLEDENIVREILRQICSTLYYLHQSNYIYYDLKPENILVKNVDGKPVIKLIDLGFSQHIINNNKDVIRGSAEYMAPEILKKEIHDYRVDLYSLGIILYRLVYKTFPFETTDELEIYKAHLEKDFEFPNSHYSKKFINIVKKLLNKNPNERYSNTLQVLNDLDIKIDESLAKDWMPAKVFSNRKDILTILQKYISDRSSGEVFTIKGFEGSGKTALVEEIYSSYDKVVYINSSNTKTGRNFVNFIIKQILYNTFIYPKLDGNTIDKIEKFFEMKTLEFIDDLKSILTSILNKNDFIIILDGFNIYDQFTHETLKNLIPIFQVNKIKVILTETSDLNYKSDFIHNLRELNLTSFTDVNLNEYIEKSFYQAFPKKELNQLILQYSDLMPGSIISFIRDAILLKIIKFSPEGCIIKADEETIKLLKSSNEEIYSERLKSLNPEELGLAQNFSTFEINMTSSNLAAISNTSNDIAIQLIENLRYKNIFAQSNSNENPTFISKGLKNYIYSAIEDKKRFHLNIANDIMNKLPDFSKTELAKQFKLGGEYNKSYEILKQELDEAEKISAYSYQKNILKELSDYPLSPEDHFEVEFNLAKAFFLTSDYKSTLEIVNKLLNEKTDDSRRRKLISWKGSSLINSGNVEEGIKVLENIVSKIENKFEKQALLLEIAGADFDLNEFDKTIEICKSIMSDENTRPLEEAKSYNLLGLVEIHFNNNLDYALEYFGKAAKIYQENDSRLRLAQIKMNIGNIYNVKGEYAKAELFWNKSLDINSSIGNLEQEARLLLNFGVYNYEHFNIEKAIEFYERADSIFISLGNLQSNGLVQYNLGEIYYLTCDYQKALESIIISRKISVKLQNTNEEMESLFLLGKFYLTMGDYENLNSILNDFKTLLTEDNSSVKHKNNYNYLVLRSKIIQKETSSFIEELQIIRKTFLEYKSKFDYFSATTKIVELMIDNDQSEHAYHELFSKEINNFCSDYFMFNAERDLMLGKIAEADSTLKLKSSIDYYLNAYHLIEESSITELTWKVLNAISVYYIQRGNISKANNYIKYTKSLILFIADGIKDNRLKKIYLEEPERKRTLEILEKYEMQN